MIDRDRISEDLKSFGVWSIEKTNSDLRKAEI